MAAKTIVIEDLKLASGLSGRSAAAYSGAFIASVARLLSLGESVTLRGLGTFSVSAVAERKTSFRGKGEEVVPAHARIVFKPAKKLRDAVWGLAAGKKKD